MNKQNLIVGLMPSVLALCVPLAGTTVGQEEPGAVKALDDKKWTMCHGKDGVAKKMADGSANLVTRLAGRDLVRHRLEGPRCPGRRRAVARCACALEDHVGLGIANGSTPQGRRSGAI